MMPYHSNPYVQTVIPLIARVCLKLACAAALQKANHRMDKEALNKLTNIGFTDNLKRALWFYRTYAVIDRPAATAGYAGS